VSAVYATEVAPQYPIARWLNDLTVDQVRRAYLRSQLTQSSVLSERDVSIGLDDGAIWEFSIGSETAIGLGFAFIHDAITVSTSCEPVWDDEFVKLDVSRLSEDSLEQFEAKIRNAANTDHVTLHSSWVALCIKNSPLTCWNDLLDWARERCEYLAVADGFLNRLTNQPFDPAIAIRSRTLLEVLNDLAGSIKNGDTALRQQIEDNYFRRKDAIFTDESDANKAKFENELTFIHPISNNPIFCPWHGKIRHKAYRLHFQWPPELEQPRPMAVMYLGPHIT
jgi:hypothetical protein